MNYLSKAREEYEKLKDSLVEDFGFKGHWEDKEVPNTLNKTLVVKGDKHAFIKHYLQDLEVINDALNLNIDDLIEEEYDETY